MPTNKEGFQMDPKLAEVMARIKVEHPAPAVDAANNDASAPKKKDPLTKVFTAPKGARFSAEILALRDGNIDK